jgi:hypothetical protein
MTAKEKFEARREVRRLKLFNKWINSDNVVKINGKYYEQTTQWRQAFTMEELYKFFKREYY